MQQYDNEIVMLKRTSLKEYEDAALEIFSILRWCNENKVNAEFLSVHRYYLKFKIKDDRDRMLFIIKWECS